MHDEIRVHLPIRVTLRMGCKSHGLDPCLRRPLVGLAAPKIDNQSEVTRNDCVRGRSRDMRSEGWHRVASCL